jgi:hypothetical protein
LSQSQPSAEFHATPHYCLRQLGVVDQHARRGGRQYEQFGRSLERLSAVTYQNDGFYDPLRREHRRVAFGFLSYSLPLAPHSSRAWRFAWDTVFFELATVIGGYLRFDLAIYRELDPASRRLFLLVSKLFRRQPRTPPLDLCHLGQHVLGIAPTVAKRDLKVKVKRCIQRLSDHAVVASTENWTSSRSSSSKVEKVQLTRGPYFSRGKPRETATPSIESPLAELLAQIGLDPRATDRCLAQYSAELLQQWLDITLAARERRGQSFFKKSAAAYFMDNVQKAAQGKRTPPDWWHDLVKEERRRQAQICRQERSRHRDAKSDDMAAGLPAALARQFRAAGQSPKDAEASAHRFLNLYREQDGNSITDLLKLLK